MYSAVRSVGGTQVAVLVGYAEKASWRIQVPNDTGAIDAGLRLDLERIGSALREEEGRIGFGGPARKRVAVDAYTVLDIATEKVLYRRTFDAHVFPA